MNFFAYPDDIRSFKTTDDAIRFIMVHIEHFTFHTTKLDEKNTTLLIRTNHDKLPNKTFKISVVDLGDVDIWQRN